MKARPKAAAACGTASSGETSDWMKRNVRVCDQLPTKSATSAVDTAAVTTPAASAIPQDRSRPGWASMTRNGSSDRALTAKSRQIAEGRQKRARQPADHRHGEHGNRDCGREAEHRGERVC